MTFVFFSFIHISTNDQISFLFMVEYCFIYIYTTYSLSIHLLRTFWLLPCPGCCKQCCNEHWGKCVFLNYDFVRA